MPARRTAFAASLAVLALSLAAGPVIAQQMSPEGDQAFWCAAAYAAFVNRSAFASTDQQSAALTDLTRFEPVMLAESERLGWQQEDVVATARQYGDEVTPQIDDYLQWKDPSALRLSLSDCFPSTGL